MMNPILHQESLKALAQKKNRNKTQSYKASAIWKKRMVISESIRFYWLEMNCTFLKAKKTISID